MAKDSFSSSRGLSALAENMEILTGKRGNNLDKAVTLRDLQSLGLATLSTVKGAYVASPSSSAGSSTQETIEIPAKPLNLSASGAFYTILVQWDTPIYKGHAYTEIWRSETDNLGDAVLVGWATADLYSDAIGKSAKVYYWIRFVNKNSVPGPFNASKGTYAETQMDVQEILDSLSGQISESQLASSLRTSIASLPQIQSDVQRANALADSVSAETKTKIDSLNTMLSNSIKSVSDALTQADALLTGKVSDLATSVDNLSWIATEARTDIQHLQRQLEQSSGVMAEQLTQLEADYQSADATVQAKFQEYMQTIADENQALVQQINSLIASYQAAADAATDANLASLSTAMANADQALAKQITTLDAAYKAADKTLTASLSQLQQTVTTNNSATAQQISALSTQIASNKSAIEETRQAVTTAEQTATEQISQVSSDLNWQLTELATTILQIQRTIATQTSVTAEQMTEMQVSFQNDVAAATAKITELARTVSTQDEATAEKLSQLATDYQTGDAKNAAALSELSETVSDQDKALSSQINSLRSEYQTSDASLQAKIDSEAQTRAAADSSQASRTDTLEAYVNGDVSNLFLNPNFTGGNAHGFTGAAGVAVFASSDSAVPTGCPTANCARIRENTTFGKTIPVTPGDIYTFALTCATADGSAPALDLGARFFDKGGAALSTVSAGTRSPSTTWARMGGEMTVPANAASMQLVITLNYTPAPYHDWFITGVSFSNANATRTLTASVQTQSQAIASIQNGVQAMWSVKTTVGDITTGIGLVTGSDGTSQVMISASQLFVFDPNGSAPSQSIFAVSGGKVTIQKAVIQSAVIEQITSMSITADAIKAGVSLSAPVISGGTLSLGDMYMNGGAAGFGRGGPYSGWSWSWHTLILSDGSLYTDRLYASGGTFTGTVYANGGTFNNVTINENCNVLGTVYANKIVGDVVAAKMVGNGQTYSIASFSKNRLLSIIVQISATARDSGNATSARAYLYINDNKVDTETLSGSGTIAGCVQLTYAIPANTGYTFRASWDGGNALALAMLIPESTGSID